MKAKIAAIIKRLQEHIPGTGCTCHAYYSGECGCNVDWRESAEIAAEFILANEKQLKKSEIINILKTL